MLTHHRTFTGTLDKRNTGSGRAKKVRHRSDGLVEWALQDSNL